MEDLYENVCAVSMPDVVLNSLSELTNFSADELASTAIPSLLKKYGRKLSNFVHQSRPGVVCSGFDHFSWDKHLGEELFYTLLSIPVETLSLQTYPAELLVTFGWTLLAVNQLDCDLISSWLSSVVTELLSLNGTNEKVNYFLNKLWDAKYCEILSLSQLENIAVTSPFVIEKLVADVIENVTAIPSPTLISYIEQDIFQKSNVNCWLKICASSSKVFQISVRIINSFLLYSRGERFVATFVQEFHRTVSKFCEGNIVSLYPLHLQKLTTFLNIRPNVLNPAGVSRAFTVNNVFQPLLDGLMSDRSTYLCLLSHFSEWIPYLLQYSIEVGEARIVSKQLFTLDF